MELTQSEKAVGHYLKRGNILLNSDPYYTMSQLCENEPNFDINMVSHTPNGEDDRKTPVDIYYYEGENTAYTLLVYSDDSWVSE